MPDLVETYRGAVYPWHCDHMGHMNVMWYVGKFDEATWRLFAHLGLTPSRLRDEARGMAAVEQHITYERELHAGDVVSIASAVVSLAEKSLRFRHVMTNDGTGGVAATSVITGVHLDLGVRRACPLPADVRARAEGATDPATA